MSHSDHVSFECYADLIARLTDPYLMLPDPDRFLLLIGVLRLLLGKVHGPAVDPDCPLCGILADLGDFCGRFYSAQTQVN